MKQRARLFVLEALGWLTALLVRRPVVAEPSRILVIKPDHLGDMLMATPPLRQLRRRFPKAHITALVGPWARFVLEGNNAVDHVQVVPFPGFERTERRTRGQGSAIARFWSFVFRLSSLLGPYLLLFRYALLLRAERYDVAIMLRDDHWWGATLALLAGIPQRIGYAVPECRPLLSEALPWDANEHVTVQGLRLVAALEDAGRNDGGETAGGRWSFRPADPLLRTEPPRVPGAEAWAEAWLREHRVAPDERLVVIHPGTGGQSKLWLPERWSAVGDRLMGLPGVRLLVTGGPGEEALVATVVKGMRTQPLTLAGTATVGQFAALLGRAALVLGVDSGPLHLAVAAGAPTIHLYGPGDSARFGPWGDPQRQVVLREALFCSPCGVFTACPRATNPSECMTLIGAGQVINAARAILNADSPQNTQNTQPDATH